MKKEVVIFISGKGTNAINIIEYSKKTESFDVSHIFSNNINFQKEKINNLNVKYFLFKNDELEFEVLKELKKIDPQLIILAGFLKKIPKSFITYFKKRIINIHPSLLPKYGGVGMYGSAVHESVIKNKEIFTGITIHYVSEQYDEGKIIFQKSISINQYDDAEKIEKKIHKLEYKYYPKIIESLLN